MNVWLLLGLLAVLSFALRTVVLLAASTRDLPQGVEQVSRHLPVAIFVAMVAAGLWQAGLEAESGADQHTVVARLAGVVVTAVVARRTRGPGRALVAGLVAFLAVRSALGT